MLVSFLLPFLPSTFSLNPAKQGEPGHKCHPSHLTSRPRQRKVERVTLGHTAPHAKTKAQGLRDAQPWALQMGQASVELLPAMAQSGDIQVPSLAPLPSPHHHPASKTRPPVRLGSPQHALQVWKVRWTEAMILRPGSKPRGLAPAYRSKQAAEWKSDL